MEAGGFSPEEEKEFLRHIKSEGERMHQIVRQLLDFARPSLRSKEAQNEPSLCDIQQSVDDVLALVRPQKTAKDVEILVDIPAELPKVLFSPAHLLQVLLNLMLNALDEVPKGEGRIRIEARLLEDGQHMRLCVEDNGKGLGRKDLCGGGGGGGACARKRKPILRGAPASALACSALF